MANDADWVADVRRWYFSSAQKPATAAQPAGVDAEDSDMIGYEAAYPSLEARQWPDTRTGFVDLK